MKWEDEARRPAPAFPERPRPPRARKDRRRWCRGKVGVEHQTTISVWKVYLARGITECHRFQAGNKWARWICVEQETCTQCGKILRHTLGAECTKRMADQ